MTDPMNFEQFREMITISREERYIETLSENRESIQIKKEKTIVKNLEKIFKATLKISNQKGFQAMTMRDLSQESGISLGAMYAYFKNKEDLIIQLMDEMGYALRSTLGTAFKKYGANMEGFKQAGYAFFEEFCVKYPEKCAGV